MQCLRKSLSLLFTPALGMSGGICGAVVSGAEFTAADRISCSGLVVAWSGVAGCSAGLAASCRSEGWDNALHHLTKVKTDIISSALPLWIGSTGLLKCLSSCKPSIGWADIRMFKKSCRHADT